MKQKQCDWLIRRFSPEHEILNDAFLSLILFVIIFIDLLDLMPHSLATWDVAKSYMERAL